MTLPFINYLNLKKLFLFSSIESQTRQTGTEKNQGCWFWDDSSFPHQIIVATLHSKVRIKSSPMPEE